VLVGDGGLGPRILDADFPAIKLASFPNFKLDPDANDGGFDDFPLSFLLDSRLEFWFSRLVGALRSRLFLRDPTILS